MAIKPSPTIAGKLRKLFSNNKQTIEPAINESIPGGSGGGGGTFTVNVTKQEDGASYTYTCDKTAEEMYAAMQTGSIKLLIPDDNEITMVQIAFIESGYYHFICNKSINADGPFADFYAGDKDQYPSYFFSDK